VVTAFLAGGADPVQWFGLGLVAGVVLGILLGRWWYTPMDLRKVYPLERWAFRVPPPPPSLPALTDLDAAREEGRIVERQAVLFHLAAQGAIVNAFDLAQDFLAGVHVTNVATESGTAAQGAAHGNLD